MDLSFLPADVCAKISGSRFYDPSEAIYASEAAARVAGRDSGREYGVFPMVLLTAAAGTFVLSVGITVGAEKRAGELVAQAVAHRLHAQVAWALILLD